MSFATFLADSTAVRERGEWWVELYLKTPAGAEEILRFSRRGTPTGPLAVTVGSDTIPAHTPFRKRLIKAPWMQASLWSAGRILTRSLPSFGELTLNNGDGGLDRYRPADPVTIAASGAGYRWGGCRCKVFLLDCRDPQGTIGKVFDGKLSTPTFGLSAQLAVPLLGREADFEVPTSTRVYHGRSYQLELSGARSAGFGSPALANQTGAMTACGWMWHETLPGADYVHWGWTGSTAFPWRIIVRTTGSLRFQCTIGGVGVNVDTATLLAAKKAYHFALRISGTSLTWYIWNETTQTLTTETATLSSATRDTVVGGTYVVQTTGTGVIWCDEYRLFNTAVALADIEADRFRPYPAGGLPAGLVHYLKFDDGSGTTVTDSSGSAVPGTITGGGTSTWLWAMEGGPELAGTPKPDLWGRVARAAPVLVDPIRQVYQVAATSVSSIATDEGGVVHTQDAAAASLRAFIVTTPTLNSSVYLAGGLVRLKAIPTLPIAATVQGNNEGTLGYASAAGSITRKLVTERRPNLVDPTDLDTASFSAYALAAPAEIGLFLPRPVPLSAALDLVNVGATGWWGFLRALTQLHVERFTGPAVSAITTFDARHIVELQEFPPLAVVYEVVVRYRHNSVVLSEEQVAASIRGTAAWQALTVEWQEKRATDDVIRAAFPGDASVSITVETCLYGDADAQTLANALLALLKGVKSGFRMTVKATGLQLLIGQTIAINFAYQDGRQRLGMTGTKMMSIVSVEDARQRGEVKLEVWG